MRMRILWLLMKMKMKNKKEMMMMKMKTMRHLKQWKKERKRKVALHQHHELLQRDKEHEISVEDYLSVIDVENGSSSYRRSKRDDPEDDEDDDNKIDYNLLSIMVWLLLFMISILSNIQYKRNGIVLSQMIKRILLLSIQ